MARRSRWRRRTKSSTRRAAARPCRKAAAEQQRLWPRQSGTGQTTAAGAGNRTGRPSPSRSRASPEARGAPSALNERCLTAVFGHWSWPRPRRLGPGAARPAWGPRRRQCIAGLRSLRLSICEALVKVDFNEPSHAGSEAAERVVAEEQAVQRRLEAERRETGLPVQTAETLLRV